MTFSSPRYSLAGPARLLANEVHIWCAALDLDSANYDCLKKTLAPDERARAARFHFVKDLQRFVASRGVLRDILGRYLHRKPAEIRFSHGSCGKPSLRVDCGTPELRFNLARSQGRELYAIAHGREVGIDVEHIEPDLANLEVAKRFFSRRECSELCALPTYLQLEAFFNCWTRKEAYVKARGEGLLMSLDSFDVSLTPGQPAELSDGGDGKWSLFALTPAPGYAAAVAVEGSNCKLRSYLWDPLPRRLMDAYADASVARLSQSARNVDLGSGRVNIDGNDPLATRSSSKIQDGYTRNSFQSRRDLFWQK